MNSVEKTPKSSSFGVLSQMQQKGALTDIMRDDVKDFKRTWTAMDHMGMVDNEKMAIFAVIAGVLHLGNISFEDDPTDRKGRRWRKLPKSSYTLIIKKR